MFHISHFRSFLKSDIFSIVIADILCNSLNFITAQTVDTVLDAALNRTSDSFAPAILNNLPDDVKKQTRKPGLRQ